LKAYRWIVLLVLQGKVRPKPEAKADETFSGRKKPPKKSPARKRAAERPGDEFDAEEMMEMMEDEDLAHLVGRGSKKRRDDDLEEEYDRERQLLNEDKKVLFVANGLLVEFTQFLFESTFFPLTSNVEMIDLILYSSKVCLNVHFEIE